MSSASEYFGAMAAEYDALIRRAVPRYDELLERLLVYLPEHATRVLELGCGTGNLSIGLARRYPAAELTLVDAAPAMLALAAARVGPERAPALVEARFEELDLAPRSFDLVASSMSLHHVADKPALFRRVRALLEPGGVFLYADQMAGGTAPFHALNWNAMEAFWKLPGHLTAAEMQDLREHAAAHDHYVTIPEQLRDLAAAGFSDLDVVWRNWMWGVVHGRAPAPRT